jgi:iron transport multicopper oxidase
LLVTNSSMTPELCIAHANSVAAAAPTPTKFPYVFIEYHGECYGGASFDFKGSAVSSLYGSKACTDWCSGSIKPYTTNGVVKYSTDMTNRCGGGKQFNLYAVSTPVVFPTTGGPVQTIKTG